MTTLHTSDVHAPSRSASRPARIALGVLLAAVMASVLNTVVAAVTHAAGASDDLQGLEPEAYLFLTVLGVLVATAGWAVVRRTRRAASTVRWLVPVALVVTWVPDLLIGIDGSQAGVTWTGVVGLMVMHVVVAAVSVAVLVRVLPVADRS